MRCMHLPLPGEDHKDERAAVVTGARRSSDGGYVSVRGRAPADVRNWRWPVNAFAARPRGRRPSHPDLTEGVGRTALPGVGDIGRTTRAPAGPRRASLRALGALGCRDLEYFAPLRRGSPSPCKGGPADGDHPGRSTCEGAMRRRVPGPRGFKRATDRRAQLAHSDVSRETGSADDPPLAGPFTRRRAAHQRINRESIAQLQIHPACVEHEARVHHMTEAHSGTGVIVGEPVFSRAGGRPSVLLWSPLVAVTSLRRCGASGQAHPAKCTRDLAW